MEKDRIKWNRKFSERLGELNEPEPFVVQSVGQLLPGSVLDLASGDGRNAVHLAARGFSVSAVDISDVALNRLAQFAKNQQLSIQTRQMDLDDIGQLDALGAFDNLLICHYKPAPDLLNRFPLLVRPGGRVILCVFNLRQHQEHGFSLRYCAQDEEYLNALPGFKVMQYEKMASNGAYLDGYLFRREHPLATSPPALE